MRCVRIMLCSMHIRLSFSNDPKNNDDLNNLPPFLPSDGMEVVISKLENWLFKGGVK